MKRMLQWIRSWRASGLALFLLQLSGRDLVRTGGCRCCGSCCRSINLRVDGRWLTSSDMFITLQQACPEYRRFVITGTDPEGLLQFTCKALQDDGRCGAYAERPAICREFPHKSLILCGGTLPPRCGYAIRAAVPFQKRLQTALRDHDRKQDPAA